MARGRCEEEKKPKKEKGRWMGEPQKPVPLKTAASGVRASPPSLFNSLLGGKSQTA
jgi:hypothetical protein